MSFTGVKEVKHIITLSYGMNELGIDYSKNYLSHTNHWFSINSGQRQAWSVGAPNVV